MEYLEIIMQIFKSINSENLKKNHILPTELYNESWMLRLVLYWFNKNREISYDKISMLQDSHWFSEGRLETIFKDDESYTKADGIFGNIKIGGNGYSDIILNKDCRQFVVTEAKMFSKFSKGIKHSRSYNQAARNIVCMCHVVEISGQKPESINDISFLTLLPKSQINNKSALFKEFIDIDNIKKTVKDRVEQYKGNLTEQDKKKWYTDIFLPFLKKIKIELISWEEIVDFIKKKDNNYGKMLQDYYDKCISFNQRAINNRKNITNNKFGRGVSLIYCKEINANSFVHLSWHGNSCRIRDYKDENSIHLSQHFTKDIKSKKLIEIEYKDRENSKNIKWWYEEIQKVNSREHKKMEFYE